MTWNMLISNMLLCIPVYLRNKGMFENWIMNLKSRIVCIKTRLCTNRNSHTLDSSGAVLTVYMSYGASIRGQDEDFDNQYNTNGILCCRLMTYSIGIHKAC